MSRPGSIGVRVTAAMRPRCGSAAARRRRRRPALRPGFEALEVRAVPSTITVLNTNDTGPDSLRAAIAQANLDPAPDTIDFAPAVSGTITLATALPDLSTAINLVGPGPSALTVARSAAAGTPAFRIFTVAAGAEVTISGLTIMRGAGTSFGSLGVVGGGIANSGTLAVTDSTLSGNTANLGGGIFNVGTLTVANSTISGNTGVGFGGSGGGIDNSGVMTVADSTLTGNSAPFGGGIDNSGGTLTVINSTLRGNSAVFGGFTEGGGDGGGIENSGTMSIANSILSGNSALGGGGISNGGTLMVTDSTLSANHGGGIENEGRVTSTGVKGGTLSVVNSTISGNTGVVGVGFVILGGGIYNAGTLTVTDSTISGNTAGSGGGIFNEGTLTVANCTLSGNSALGGGGIDNESVGALTVVDSTLSGNSAREGGGIFNAGTLTVTDSTISGNMANSDGGGIFSTSSSGSPPSKATVLTSLFANPAGGNLVVGAGSPFVSLGHNLFTDAPAIPLDRTDLINTDPLLSPLANNGGPTFTQALLPGSPALDAGIAVAGVTADQRGVPRPQGAAPDIGAFESRGFTLAVASGSDQSTAAGSAFAAPLVVQVASPFGEPVAGGRVTFAAPAAGASAILAGNPATIGPDGQASATATANGGVGTYIVTAQASGAAGGVGFSLINVVENPSITMVPTAGTGSVGQPQTVTATLKNGNGTPLTGIPVIFQVAAGPNAGAAGTTNPADGLTGSDGQVAFTYTGAAAGTDTIVASATIPGAAAPVSSTATVAWDVTAPPTVVSLRRFGFHLQPTTLVLTFSQPMDAARAQDLANYTLVELGHGGGRIIPLKAARYDATAQAVTLFPVPLLSLQRTYQITVDGAPPSGLTSASGVPLGGRGNGQAGTDFVARFDRRALVLPPTGNGPGADVPRPGRRLLTLRDLARLAALRRQAFGITG